MTLRGRRFYKRRWRALQVQDNGKIKGPELEGGEAKPRCSHAVKFRARLFRKDAEENSRGVESRVGSMEIRENQKIKTTRKH
jgi:hypothetical protein